MRAVSIGLRGAEMRYIERILEPGERVIHTSRLHWIIYFPGIVFVLVGAGFFVVAAMMPQLIWVSLSAFFAIVGFAMLFLAWFRRWTTEFDVTDRRIIYKRGFIWRHSVEMNMNKVESVDVDQSIFGRVLRYGNITIRGTGTGMEPMRNINDPIKFRNSVTAR
jgi:uncharacterized membrane protein YdbT with pleckstrin-like domain